MLGVAGATRWRSTRWPRFVVAGLHRNLTLLALVFIALHVITTVADGYAPISLLNAVIPFTSPYRPLWLGLGARRLRSPARVDDHEPAARAHRLRQLAGAALACVRLVAHRARARARHRHRRARRLDAGDRRGKRRAAWSARFSGGSSADRATPALRTATTIGTIAIPLVIGGWYLARACASRLGGAGRHAALAARTLHHGAAAVARTAAAASVPALPTSSFTGTFSGRVRESSQDANGRVLVNISGRTSGGSAGVLWIRLQGEPIDGGGVSMTASGASYGPASFPDAYVGKIVGLEGTRILLSLNGQANKLSLLLDLRVDSATGTATGTVHGQADASLG